MVIIIINIYTFTFAFINPVIFFVLNFYHLHITGNTLINSILFLFELVIAWRLLEMILFYLLI